MPSARLPNASGSVASGARKISRPSTCASRYSHRCIGLAIKRFSSFRSRALTIGNATAHSPLVMMPIPISPGISQST